MNHTQCLVELINAVCGICSIVQIRYEVEIDVSIVTLKKYFDDRQFMILICPVEFYEKNSLLADMFDEMILFEYYALDEPEGDNLTFEAIEDCRKMIIGLKEEIEETDEEKPQSESKEESA